MGNLLPSHQPTSPLPSTTTTLFLLYKSRYWQSEPSLGTGGQRGVPTSGDTKSSRRKGQGWHIAQWCVCACGVMVFLLSQCAWRKGGHQKHFSTLGSKTLIIGPC